MGVRDTCRSTTVSSGQESTTTPAQVVAVAGT
jgi:hypothetical protein